MSAVRRPYCTVAQYLALERKAEHRSEYYDGNIFAMAGATPEHNAVKENLVIRLGSQMLDGPCRSYSSDQRVRTPSGLFTYPDVVVVCGQPEFDPQDPNTLVNPQVVIEVLSPSTESYDRGRKFEHYQSLPSLREYVLASADRMRIDHFVRQPGGGWLLTSVAGPDDELALATVPAKVKLRDVYARVELPTASESS